MDNTIGYSQEAYMEGVEGLACIAVMQPRVQICHLDRVNHFD
jgi:hypothetical protein